MTAFPQCLYAQKTPFCRDLTSRGVDTISHLTATQAIFPQTFQQQHDRHFLMRNFVFQRWKSKRFLSLGGASLPPPSAAQLTTGIELRSPES